MAKKYHPDANPGNNDAANMFAVVAEAYSVMSNKQQRDAYDGGFSSGGGGGPGGQSNSNNQDFDPIRRSNSSAYEASFHSSVDPEALFKKIFGADFSSSDFMGKSNRVWVDFAATDAFEKTESTIVRLSFRDAAKGCEKIINAKTVTTCEKCMGIGYVLVKLID